MTPQLRATSQFRPPTQRHRSDLRQPSLSGRIDPGRQITPSGGPISFHHPTQHQSPPLNAATPRHPGTGLRQERHVGPKVRAMRPIRYVTGYNSPSPLNSSDWQQSLDSTLLSVACFQANPKADPARSRFFRHIFLLRRMKTCIPTKSHSR